FAINGPAARDAQHIYFPAVTGNLDVAFRVGNFTVPLSSTDIHAPAGAANFDVANSIRHINGLGHVRNGDIALLIANRQQGLLWNRHVEIEADPRIARADSRGVNLVAVAILRDLHPGPLGKLLRVALIPGLGVLFSGYANFRTLRRTHAVVSASVVYHN